MSEEKKKVANLFQLNARFKELEQRLEALEARLEERDEGLFERVKEWVKERSRGR